MLQAEPFPKTQVFFLYIICGFIETKSHNGFHDEPELTM